MANLVATPSAIRQFQVKVTEAYVLLNEMNKSDILTALKLLLNLIEQIGEILHTSSGKVINSFEHRPASPYPTSGIISNSLKKCNSFSVAHKSLLRKRKNPQPLRYVHENSGNPSASILSKYRALSHGNSNTPSKSQNLPILTQALTSGVPASYLAPSPSFSPNDSEATSDGNQGYTPNEPYSVKPVDNNGGSEIINDSDSENQLSEAEVEAIDLSSRDHGDQDKATSAKPSNGKTEMIEVNEKNDNGDTNSEGYPVSVNNFQGLYHQRSLEEAAGLPVFPGHSENRNSPFEPNGSNYIPNDFNHDAKFLGIKSEPLSDIKQNRAFSPYMFTNSPLKTEGPAFPHFMTGEGSGNLDLQRKQHWPWQAKSRSSSAAEIPDDERINYRCGFCKKVVQYAEVFHRHLKSHVSKTVNTCDLCNIHFAFRSNLFRHIRRYHIEYVCALCQETFAKPKQLEQHLQILHSDKSAIVREVSLR